MLSKSCFGIFAGKKIDHIEVNVRRREDRISWRDPTLTTVFDVTKEPERHHRTHPAAKKDEKN